MAHHMAVKRTEALNLEQTTDVTEVVLNIRDGYDPIGPAVFEYLKTSKVSERTRITRQFVQWPGGGALARAKSFGQ